VIRIDWPARVPCRITSLIQGPQQAYLLRDAQAQSPEEAMNYFTPELIAQGQTTDHDVLDRHEEEWDQVCERYEAYLAKVRPHMPPGLRHILDSYYLHDAVVLGMGQQDRVFLLVVQLDTPPRSLLTFQYDLVNDPVIIRDALPAGLRATGDLVDWQYNEIEMVPGTPPTWRESTLFSNGWEVHLHFRDVQVLEVQTLIPTPHRAPLPSAALAPSA
jgi:hypothetical protein